MLKNMYKNYIVSGTNYKPLLHKKGKQWITIGLSALTLIGLGGIAQSNVHASTNTVKANMNQDLASRMNNNIKSMSNAKPVQQKQSSTNDISSQANALHNRIVSNNAQFNNASSASNNSGVANNASSNNNSKASASVSSASMSNSLRAYQAKFASNVNNGKLSGRIRLRSAVPSSASNNSNKASSEVNGGNKASKLSDNGFNFNNDINISGNNSKVIDQVRQRNRYNYAQAGASGRIDVSSINGAYFSPKDDKFHVGTAPKDNDIVTSYGGYKGLNYTYTKNYKKNDPFDYNSKVEFTDGTLPNDFTLQQGTHLNPVTKKQENNIPSDITNANQLVFDSGIDTSQVKDKNAMYQSLAKYPNVSLQNGFIKTVQKGKQIGDSDSYSIVEFRYRDVSKSNHPVLKSFTELESDGTPVSSSDIKEYTEMPTNGYKLDTKDYKNGIISMGGITNQFLPGKHYIDIAMTPVGDSDGNGKIAIRFIDVSKSNHPVVSDEEESDSVGTPFSDSDINSEMSELHKYHGYKLDTRDYKNGIISMGGITNQFLPGTHYIDIAITPNVVIKAPVMVRYINQRGATVGGGTVKENAGQQINVTDVVKVPEGYHVNPYQHTDITVPKNPTSQIIFVTGNTVSNRVFISYDDVTDNGHTVGSKKITVSGQVGDTKGMSQQIDKYIPSGYKYVSSNKDNITLNNNEIPQSVIVNVAPKPRPKVPDILNFITPSDIHKHVTIIGNINSDVKPSDITNNVPKGYHIKGNIPNIKYDGGDHIINIVPVSKPAGTVTINYVDQTQGTVHYGQVIGSQQISNLGNVGDNIQLGAFGANDGNGVKDVLQSPKGTHLEDKINPLRLQVPDKDMTLTLGTNGQVLGMHATHSDASNVLPANNNGIIHIN